MGSVRQPLRLVVDRSARPVHAVSITIGVRDRRPVFLDGLFARHCIDFLRALSTMTGTRLYAYCLMPDHAHLLVSPSTTASVAAFVGRWKALCDREWARRRREPSFWRAGFEERPLRRGEDLLKRGHYILSNPVRAGLVERSDEYRFSGSCEWDLETDRNA